MVPPGIRLMSPIVFRSGDQLVVPEDRPGTIRTPNRSWLTSGRPLIVIYIAGHMYI
jgi:hypothetical protein